MTYSYEEFGTPQLDGFKKWMAIIGAVLVIVGVWFVLTQKLILGDAWLSQTYDHAGWKTNEGDLPTYGAWDLEAHIWKTEFIMENFPNFKWNPYWYLGMPLLKYYQFGFYAVHWLVMTATGLSAAKAATWMIAGGHLLATLTLFSLCYKVSGRVLVSMLCSLFLLENTFLSLRSYGWEPITVVFLFIYPLGLLFFLSDPLRPFRVSVVLLLGLAYLMHPLIWFTLCMFMGLFLFIVAFRHDHDSEIARWGNYLWSYLATVGSSLLIGAIQFIPMLTYEQVTSGAHMGVKYLPYYQVPYNILKIENFLFDAGNLKGPGPIVMIALFFTALFVYYNWRDQLKERLEDTYLTSTLMLVLITMVSFYYLEYYNVFPMNILRSVQYHRIIPEFIVTGAVLVAAMSTLLVEQTHKVIYYTVLIAFVITSGIIIADVQSEWRTTPTLEDSREMQVDAGDGRISMTYLDQSLSVRQSFKETSQAYGYYEQGITNAYADEIFSVSSGYHNANVTELYLQAANVDRLYVNKDAGERDYVVQKRFNRTYRFVPTNNSRYGYFDIPVQDTSRVEAVSSEAVSAVNRQRPGCREMYQETYCGSKHEEFVSTDIDEAAYLNSYVDMLERPHAASASSRMVNPEEYRITVRNATQDTAVVVKMNHDPSFDATVNGESVAITKVGPDFMLIEPGRAGSYTITLEYHTSDAVLAGAAVSAVSILVLLGYFAVRTRRTPQAFKEGDM